MAENDQTTTIEVPEEDYIYPPYKSPFPYFGGKSRVVDIVWPRFGDTINYVEPFAGSLAMLLRRPYKPRIETVNDLDCFVSNFWRALRFDPEAVADAADWPVNEADLHARHLWLVNQTEFREKMKTDPDFYDPQVAGWWVYGISCWIGGGWCAGKPMTDSHIPRLGNAGAGIHRKLPSLGDAGVGVHRQLPSLGDGGKGVHSKMPSIKLKGVNRQIPHLGSNGQGIHSASSRIPMLKGSMGIHASDKRTQLFEYMMALSERLRTVRVCCGDWSRVTGPSVTHKLGMTAVFLDPPYADTANRAENVYAEDSLDVAHEVRRWAIEQGENPLMRIALCGYEGEHEMPPEWECVEGKAAKGYAGQRKNGSNDNNKKERIWFSPACLKVTGPKQSSMFFGDVDEVEEEDEPEASVAA